MGLYNVLFGTNQHADALLAALGLTRESTGRFRDCFISDGRIAVYTRNGGGNREEYQPVLDKLAAHPCWLYDEDDSFDSTYCTIYFKLPPELEAAWKQLEAAKENATAHICPHENGEGIPD